MAGPTDAWILISGENGTGKELVAKTLHQFSARSEMPLIDVNCAAIPEESIESELLGHEKGAFSGAATKKRGKFELANHGTIFLDEIGDMSLRTQSKILRVLQEQKFQRIGSSRVLDIDIRVIAASNKNLEIEIEKGNFREDLYYRLNVIPIDVPPLRERLEDIPLLMETFLDEFAKQNQLKKKSITPDTLEQLQRYSWPGNVRELKNLAERLAIMVEKETIDVTDIPDAYTLDIGNAPSHTKARLFAENSLPDALKAFEKEFLRRKLSQYDNDIRKTAAALNIEQGYLHTILENR